MPAIRVVHVGDSITFGQHIDPAVRWTSLVRDRLVARYRDTNIAIESINSGVSGDTTRMALERFPRDVQAFEAPVVTIQFGLNDCNCWATDRGVPRVSPAAFEANLVEMIARARNFGARHVVVATNHRTLRRTVLPTGETYEEASARYTTVTRAVAKALDVQLCDVRAVFEKFTDDQLDDLLLTPPDQVHLSEAGNVVYTDVIWPYIDAAVAACAVGMTEPAPL
jgi:lysophospholipase L1-like esterase